MKIRYNNKIYSTFSIQTIFGINVKTLNRYISTFDSDIIDLEDIVNLYNKEHKETPVDITQKLEIKSIIENNTYIVLENNNEPLNITYIEVIDLIKKRNPKVKNESIYTFLRKRYESGIINDNVDIVIEFEKYYQEATSKNYTYLYPDKNGNLVMTKLNYILCDYKKKNPESTIKFDSLKKYIELAIEQGSSPKEAVNRGIELYNSIIVPKQKYILKNSKTGEYEEVTIGKIKQYWKEQGFVVSKIDTVKKYLIEAQQIPGISPEEVVDKALVLAMKKNQKFDYEVDGKVKKLSLQSIAKHASNEDSKIPYASLCRNILRLKKENQELSELDLVKKAIEECKKNRRKTYPYLDEDGNIVNLTVTEISRKCNINRNYLSQIVKELENNNDEYSDEEIILAAINIAKKEVKANGSHYYPDKEYEYVLEDGKKVKMRTKDLTKIVKEKYGIKVIPENLQKTMDDILTTGKYSVNEACKKAAITIEGKHKLLKKPMPNEFSDLSISDLAIILGISITEVEVMKKRFTDKEGLIDIEKFEEECEKIYQTINQRKSSQKKNTYLMSDQKTTVKDYCIQNKYNYTAIKNMLVKQIAETGTYNAEDTIKNYIENGQRDVTNYKYSFANVLYKHAALLAGLDFDKIVYRMRKDKIDLKKASELVILSIIPNEMDFVSSTISNMLYSKNDDELKKYFMTFSEFATKEEKECLNGVWKKEEYIIEINKYILFSNFLQKRNLTLSDDIEMFAEKFDIKDFNKFKNFLENFEGTPSYLKAPSHRKSSEPNIE